MLHQRVVVAVIAQVDFAPSVHVLNLVAYRVAALAVDAGTRVVSASFAEAIVSRCVVAHVQYYAFCQDSCQAESGFFCQPSRNFSNSLLSPLSFTIRHMVRCGMPNS